MRLIKTEICKIKEELFEHNGKMYYRSKYSSGEIIWERFPFGYGKMSSKKEKELEKAYQKLCKLYKKLIKGG